VLVLVVTMLTLLMCCVISKKKEEVHASHPKHSVLTEPTGSKLSSRKMGTDWLFLASRTEQIRFRLAQFNSGSNEITW
jgi:hypothetical protein